MQEKAQTKVCGTDRSETGPTKNRTAFAAEARCDTGRVTARKSCVPDRKKGGVGVCLSVKMGFWRVFERKRGLLAGRRWPVRC